MNGKIIFWSTGFVALVAAIGAGLGLRGHMAGDDGPPLSGSVEHFKPAADGAALPPVSFLDAAGNKIAIADLRGKLLLVNLWATWCAPCVEEMPSLEALDSQRRDSRFEVVTISEDTTNAAEKVTKFFASHAIKTLPAYLDPDFAVGPALKVAGLPTTLLVSPQGIELGRLEGNADWASPEALRLIDWYAAKVAKGEL